MSNLGDKLQDEIDDIKALTEGENGWASPYEAFVDKVQTKLNDAAPDTIRNADGTIGADVDNQLTSAEGLSVTDQFRKARSESWSWEFWADTIDNFSENASGSGASALAGDYLLSTGTTAGSNIRGYRQIHPGGMAKNQPSWDKGREARFQIDVNTLSEEGRVVTGVVEVDDATYGHMGFLFSNGDIQATVANGGTTVNTATLVAGAATGAHDLYCRLTASTEAEFWVDKDPDETASDGTLTSDIPTGTTNARFIFTTYAQNPNGTDFDLRVQHAEVTEST